MTERCEHCGTTYALFRLEAPRTFREARALMFTSDPPPWRQKRRRSVLGFWHELKRMAWQYHLDQCAWAARETEGDHG